MDGYLDLNSLNPPLNPVLVITDSGLHEMVSFCQSQEEVGFDTETNITPTFYHRKVRTVQVGNRDRQYVLDLLAFSGSTEGLTASQGRQTPGTCFRRVVEALDAIAGHSGIRKVGHNLQFDYEVLKWCLGVRLRNTYDTELCEKLLYAGKVNLFAKGFWALDDLVERYCKRRIDKSLQTTFDLSSPLTPAQVKYAALDTRLVLAIKGTQYKRIQAEKLERVAELENAAIGAFGDMHLNGILLDRDKWLALVEQNKLKHAANIKELDRYFMRAVGNRDEPPILVDLQDLESKWRSEKNKELRAELRKQYQAAAKTLREWEKAKPTWEGQAAINYGSNDQVLKALHELGVKLKDTNDKTLSKHAHVPVVSALRDYRETAKLLSTYGEKFLQYIDPDTGRVHSRINQIGADTGRTSSTKPNIQNLPSDKAFRSCFVARPGYKFLTCDMSGAELRILAEISKDPIWIEAFQNDWDLHSIGGKLMNASKWEAGTEEGCQFVIDKQKCECKAHKKVRNDSKAISFGVAYGMEEYALAGRLQIPPDEARKLLAKWRKSNAGVNVALTQLGNSAKSDLVATTLAGRKRWFTKPTWDSASLKSIESGKATNKIFFSQYGSIEREGKNHPIQGTNADIAKLAMGLMAERLETEYGACLVGFVHDEVDVEVPEEKAEACAAFIQQCFLEAGSRLMKEVEMKSEYHIGDCWTK